MISKWKAEFLANMGSVFDKSGKAEEPDVDTQELYAQIGQLKVENEFLKKSFKKLGDSGEDKLDKCQYYKPVPEKPENIKMMEIMDKHLTDHPTEGVVSLVLFFIARSYPVGPKRIRRLLKIMGRETLYRRKNLTKLGLRKFIRPYLLRGVEITRPNQVW